LRRITTVNRVEVQRETTRVEYRCPLPEPGLRLLNASIDAANAAAGFSDPAVRSDPEAGSERPRGTGDSLFGTDGDLRRTTAGFVAVGDARSRTVTAYPNRERSYPKRGCSDNDCCQP
jgi:hypothetical protein